MGLAYVVVSKVRRGNPRKSILKRIFSIQKIIQLFGVAPFMETPSGIAIAIAFLKCITFVNFTTFVNFHHALEGMMFSLWHQGS